jgi:hypothetical protein
MYGADVERIVSAFASRELQVPRSVAQQAWMSRSASVCAGWLFVSESPAEIVIELLGVWLVPVDCGETESGLLQLKPEPIPPASRPEVARMAEVLQSKGYEAKTQDLYEVWRDYSELLGVDWFDSRHESDEALAPVILEYLVPARGENL